MRACERNAAHLLLLTYNGEVNIGHISATRELSDGKLEVIGVERERASTENMPVASAALVSYKDTASQSRSVLLPIQNTTMNPDLGLFINDRAEQLAILTLSASGSFTPTLYYAPGLLPEIDPAASTSIEIVRVVVPLTFDAAGAASEQPRTIQRPAQALSVVARELSIGSGATVGSLLQDNPILAAGRFMLLTPGGVSDWPGYQAYIIVSTPPDGSDSNLSPICYVCYIGICPSYCRTPA